MKYLKTYENIDWDDWDEEEQAVIDPYSLKFPVKGIVNNKFSEYCDKNNWSLWHYVGRTITIKNISSFGHIDLNGIYQPHKDCYYYYNNGSYYFPFDSVDIIS